MLIAVAILAFYAFATSGALFVRSPRGGKSYYVTQRHLIFAEARQLCDALNSELFMPQNVREQQFVTSLVTNSSGGAMWAAAIPLSYVASASGPSNCGKCCIVFDPFGAENAWQVSSCDDRHQVVCERKPEMNQFTIEFNGNEYAYYNTPVNYYTAQITCQKIAAKLLEPKTVTEAVWFAQLFDDKDIWLGAHCEANCNGYDNFRWASGATFDYRPLRNRKCTQEPCCLHLGDGKWTSRSCSALKPFLCERTGTTSSFIDHSIQEHEQRLYQIERELENGMLKSRAAEVLHNQSMAMNANGSVNGGAIETLSIELNEMKANRHALIIQLYVIVVSLVACNVAMFVFGVKLYRNWTVVAQLHQRVQLSNLNNHISTCTENVSNKF